MTTNAYFNSHIGNTNEQELLQDLTTECIQFNGFDIEYIPRTLNDLDNIFHEDTVSSFESFFTIEMYIESSEGYSGDAEMLSKFGLVINDESTLIVSSKRFTEEGGSTTKPEEGDLIRVPFSDTLFEISWVEDESPFFPLGSLPSYKLNVKTFSYSEETMTTGITTLDNLESLQDQENIYSDNTDIETEGDSIVDWSENNIFGDF